MTARRSGRALREARAVLILALALTLPACGLFKPRAPTSAPSGANVPPFSAGSPGNALPPGWRYATVGKFRLPTQYELVDDDGITVVHAVAKAAHSGLVADLNVDLTVTPILRWRWKVVRAIPRADNTRRAFEDAPARVELGFEGNTKTLPMSDRLFYKQVKAVSGIEMPYATLEYIWGAGAPVGTIIVNEWTSRIRMLMVQNTAERTGEWITEERNVYEDYLRVFGEPPGRVTHLAVVTDTDATGETAEAYFGDIRFLPAPKP